MTRDMNAFIRSAIDGRDRDTMEAFGATGEKDGENHYNQNIILTTR